MLVESATPECLTRVAILQAQLLGNNGPFYAGEAHTGKTSPVSRLSPIDQKLSSFEPPNTDRSVDEAGVHRKDLLHDYNLYRWNRCANV